MPTLKSKTETFIVVDFHDLDNFIREVTGVEDYDFMCAEEGPKDGHKAFRVNSEMDEYDEKEYKNFLSGSRTNFITQTILRKLCKDGLISAGNYLIACFW